MPNRCEQISDDLADLVAGDPDAIARHAEHLASCDDCRDARHDASQLPALVARASADHVTPTDLAGRVFAALDQQLSAPLHGAAPVVEKPAPAVAPVVKTEPVATPTLREPAKHSDVTPIHSSVKRPSRRWLAISASAAAIAAGAVGVVALNRGDSSTDSGVAGVSATSHTVGKVKEIQRAAKDRTGGLSVREGTAWRPLEQGQTLPIGAELRTDDRTRVAIELADGTRVVLDHGSTLALDAKEPRKMRLASGRAVADVMTVANRPASIATPAGSVEVIGTHFAVTATDALTSVQVIRGSVRLVASGGADEEVRAGEEGLIEGGKLSVTAAPGIAREVEWSELTPPVASDETATAGLGALRAYKPGEKRDRDWNLALAKHDVKVRIAGPVARTEITEVFRNDSDSTLEGVYQFPLPADAQIDSLALDVEGGFETGAFVDKERAAKIWRGVIDKATPKVKQEIASDIIWVQGPWRDPALLDWKRGGRFELRIFPIPAKGARTIKIAYTQVVTPRGPWRQYVYPLPHSKDGSTVADQFSVDVEVRGAVPGVVRASGYQLTADPKQGDTSALTMSQGGFVPRGDLVVDYRPIDGDAELRAWTFTGGAAVAPDDKLAVRKNVGIDPAVVAAQRAQAADARPTAVLALRPKLPRWREAKPRDYTIIIDGSQSMVGERFARASKLAGSLVEQMDRRDRFSISVCDSECRRHAELQAPSSRAATDVQTWLGTQQPAGASDVVAAIRSAILDLKNTAAADRERWVLYVGDGFATTGFRRVADVERAIAHVAESVQVGTIGIGSDADGALLAAVARGGGGSYLAWVPGQTVKAAAVASLESSYGTALRRATVELPTGLTDVAPTVLPTVRAGEEILVAARVSGEVSGEVVLRGTVGGQPFEQRYPVKLGVSAAAGNGFVPRLWASLAIDQLERAGNGADRAKIVALSQGYGVMSRETSLLVLESAAMFDAFGVDRSTPASAWTGEEAVEEVVAKGNIDYEPPAPPKHDPAPAMKAAGAKDKPKRMLDVDNPWDGPGGSSGGGGGGGGAPAAPAEATVEKSPPMPTMPRGRGMIAMRRIWVRVPSLHAYEGVNPRITKAIATAEAALAQTPDSRERHRALVQALSYAGEIERAREVANRWLERDRLDPQALGYIADLLGRAGQRDLALRMLAGLVDLDADRVVLHERMIGAYDRAGRAAQACSHRIALATISMKDAKRAGAAVRCLRTLGRDRDAELVLRGLPEDKLRADAEKAATVAPVTANRTRDLVVDAHWQGSEDLDISLITPDGARVSWMGGRIDVGATDVTSTAREQLALRSLRRGNYLVEISRADASQGTVRGTVDLAVLGQKKSLPFELTGARATVGRIAITLDERLEAVDPSMRPFMRGRQVR